MMRLPFENETAQRPSFDILRHHANWPPRMDLSFRFVLQRFDQCCLVMLSVQAKMRVLTDLTRPDLT